MDRKLYELEGLRQLTYTHYYTEIERPLANETVTLLQNTLNDIYRSSFLSEKKLRYLSSEVPEKSRPFYLLPKVHKPRHKWPHPNMPEGRPIVADCGSETNVFANTLTIIYSLFLLTTLAILRTPTTL